MSNSDEKYRYYELSFVNCHMAYNTAIVDKLSEVMEYLELILTDLDDESKEASVTITSIGMTTQEIERIKRDYV